MNNKRSASFSKKIKGEYDSIELNATGPIDRMIDPSRHFEVQVCDVVYDREERFACATIYMSKEEIKEWLKDAQRVVDENE